MNDVWTHAVVKELRPGAEYQGTRFDQDVVFELAGGEQWCLFDMAPMIGSGLQLGQAVLVLAALSTPRKLHRQVEAKHILETEEWRPVQTAGSIRPEVYSRGWAVLRHPAGSILIPRSEISAAGLAAGTPLAWENGRLDLLAWKPDPAQSG